jgi:hypothetical protein
MNKNMHNKRKLKRIKKRKKTTGKLKRTTRTQSNRLVKIPYQWPM